MSNYDYSDSYNHGPHDQEFDCDLFSFLTSQQSHNDSYLARADQEHDSPFNDFVDDPSNRQFGSPTNKQKFDFQDQYSADGHDIYGTQFSTPNSSNLQQQSYREDDYNRGYGSLQFAQNPQNSPPTYKQEDQGHGQQQDYPTYEQTPHEVPGSYHGYQGSYSPNTYENEVYVDPSSMQAQITSPNALADQGESTSYSFEELLEIPEPPQSKFRKSNTNNIIKQQQQPKTQNSEKEERKTTKKSNKEKIAKKEKLKKLIIKEEEEEEAEAEGIMSPSIQNNSEANTRPQKNLPDFVRNQLLSLLDIYFYQDHTQLTSFQSIDFFYDFINQLSSEQKEALEELLIDWKANRKVKKYENGKTYNKLFEWLAGQGQGGIVFRQLFYLCVQEGRDFIQSEVWQNNKIKAGNKSQIIAYLNKLNVKNETMQIVKDFDKNWNLFQKKHPE